MDDVFFAYIVLNITDQTLCVAYSETDARMMMKAMGDDIGTLIGVMRNGILVAITPTSWYVFQPVPLEE